MPNRLTTEKLQAAKAMITDGRVLDFYNYMASQGYGYANLAKGVVECSLLSGGSTAQAFMTVRAAELGIPLPPEKVVAVEREMATRYADRLIELSRADGAGGAVSRDWTFAEALQGHNDGFRAQGLPESLWTLYGPSRVLSPAELEGNWQLSIDPALNPTTGPVLSFTFGFAKDMSIAGALAALRGDTTTFKTYTEWWATGVEAEAVGLAASGGYGSTTAGCAAGLSAAMAQLRQKADANYAQDPIAPPVDLGTPTRDSSAYIVTSGAHSVQLLSGGTISDLWLQQKNAGNVFTLEEFGRAVLASNPAITDVNSVGAGQVILVPEKQRDGSVTFHYEGGASVNSNAASGEYRMSVPNGAGGMTIYERIADADAGYRVRQTALDASGRITLESVGFQPTLNDEVRNLSTYTLNASGTYDGTTKIDDSLVAFTAQYDESRGVFRPSSIAAINEAPVEEGALTGDDLSAAGFAAPGPLTDGARQLIRGLDPQSAQNNGWSAPGVEEVAIPQGFERRVELGNGWTSISQYDSDRRLVSVTETYSPSSFEAETRTYQVNADGSRTLLTQGSRMIGSDGSYVGTETDVTTRQVFRVSGDADGNTERVLDIDGTNTLGMSDTATVLSDVNGFVNAIRSGQPIPLFASGVRLLNSLSIAGGIQNTNLAAANNVAAGVLSFYNLYNAFNSGNDFEKLNASLTAFNYANEAFSIVGGTGGAVSTFLNGPVNGIAGGSVGVIPALGLVASIKAEDPIGIAMSLGTMIEGAPFLTTNPVGWCLIGASVLKAIFSDDSPPDAWGVAKVTFGEGFTNVDPLVQASGENFGPDRVRQQLQGVVDVITQIIANNNQSTSDSSHYLGLIPQRMPGLTFHAAEFQDKGYAVADIDPLTGAQRIPFVRFDDNGQPFGFVPEQLTAQERAMLSIPGSPGVPPLVAYMLNSALDRSAIAPMWEVRTAKLQEQAGDPNAGLTEEERAAKAGYAAPIDTQYAAAHAGDPEARNRRQGHFMAVGLDLSGDGRIDTRTISQIEAGGQTITFDWDGQGYQKETGWIGAGDAFLVLDHDFNQSADSAKELLSNPLIADAGKGLRVLAAYDANGDGRIDASDPVYQQLKVWQDLNQDGNNTHTISVNAVSSLAQDESGGLRELRSLAEAGITAIDYANGRFEMGDGNYRLIATETLEAQDEGTRYTPVGAGIKLQVSNGAPQIVVTQVQSEQAVYEGLQIAAGGETIGAPGAELYEDGLPTAYDPNTQGGPIELVISAAQLLQNDTWAGEAGAQAGLALTSVRAGAHTSASLRPDGNISLRLEANYNGAAEFFYTVAVPGYESLITPREARVGLNITPVNDAPTVGNAYAPDRPVYGYAPLGYSYTHSNSDGEDATYETISGTVPGTPIYQPYIEHIPEQPIYEWQWVGSGEDMYQQQVQVGTTAAYDIAHDTVIATDRSNTGRVMASDADGGSFSYEVLTQAAYGTAAVDANGNWSYLGRRPQDYYVRDVNGDGQRDWVDPGTGAIENVYVGDPNIDSNAYAGDENQSFADYFTVRVYDNSDPTGQTFRDVEVQATHYGPAPLPIVADSGGKKPIAVDLDGDGFHFTDVDDSNVFFEVNGDGWKRRMAWTEPGDGLLAYDRNADGNIDRSDEISFVPYAPGQQTDMAALRAAFDTNGDGRFDAGDAQWSSFGVWRDANSNGVTDPGEFRSLQDMGITSIDLSTDGQFRVIDGQTVHGIGSATFANGGSVAVADVTLRYTNETQVVTVNPDGTTTTSTVLAPASTLGQDFEGTPDKDLVFGTKGSDRFRMSDGDDVVIDDGGNDVVDAGGGDDQVFTGIDNDVVYGGNGNDSIYTGAGNDLVFGDGAGETGDDLIMLEDGNDIAFGGFGNDFISGGLGNDVLSGNAGNDKLFGEAGWDVLFGQDGDDELYGMDGNDMIDGGAGNDLLDGGAGDDSMEGGAGDDTYHVDSTGDTVIEAAGGGNDTVESSITYTLGENLENLRLVGDGSIDGTGNAVGNLLVGNDHNNTLAGLGGNDVLDGGLGADTLIGGAGDDAYVIDNAGDRVVEAAGEGNDTIRSRITTTLSANVENLTLVGINRIDGTGNGEDNVIVGNVTANVLDGGAGIDVMRGGRGNDTYIVDNAGDVVVENPGEGADSVVASVSYALSANVENLTLTGAAISGTGNGLGNVLVGNGRDNLLDGGAGADTLVGGVGDDTYIVDDAGDTVLENAEEGHDRVFAGVDFMLAANVEDLVLTGSAVSGTGNELANLLQGNAQGNVLDGGAGADTLAGGAGGDTYVVDDSGDIVIEAADGVDTVIASVSYTLTDNVEKLTLTGSADLAATGNRLDNVLTGNTGSNLLDGGAGADTLAGGAGDDIYIVDDAGDAVIEAAGEGVDTVRASVSYGLSDNVENLVLTGSADIDGIGNALDNVLQGNDAANRLDGGAGADWMAGAAGDDTYVVDDAGDQVIEAAGAGNDTVEASVTYTLSDNVDNLVLTGSADIDGYGNALDNVLTGNRGANLLDGGAGADVMVGGAGDDAYVVDNAGDLVTEWFAAGNDTVLTGIDYVLPENVENLILTGTAVSGTGNELANLLQGNAQGNVLDGGAGADTLAGGVGDDTYVVDDAGDQVIEAAGAGNDTVEASVTYTLSDNVENLMLTGSADLAATGNRLDNVLTGNTGSNLLDGGAGADTLAGGAGHDTYMVENVDDTVIEAAGEGIDTVVASVSYALSANVENLTLTSTAVTGTGNDLGNILLGNALDNVLDGGAGADTLAGGAGDDTYIVDDAGDAVIEAAGEGVDTVRASVSYGLSDNVENLVLTGSADIDGIGNALDNVLQGNDAANRLDGGAGADSMAGAAGDDTYVVDNAGDLVTEWFAAGNDTVLAGIDYVLPQNVDNLILTGTAVAGTGNELANTITANALDNLLDGAEGADAIAGGAGNDTYIVDNAGDTVYENAGEGTDHVVASVSYTLSDNVENLTLVGSADLSGTGNELTNIIEGNDGANLIDGGAGADTVAGGAGDDRYMVDDAADAVIEAEGAGHDTVISSVSYALSDNVEDLVLTGTAASGTGNVLDNLLIGDAIDNLLDGGGGADRMVGGGGNDTYIVDNAGDTVVEAAAEGLDTVHASVTYTLADNVDNLVLTGGADIDGTGNALDNVIAGNGGNNVLDGGLGDDTYVWQAGDGLDRIVDADGVDTVQFGAGLSLDNVVLHIAFVGDQKIAQVRVRDAAGNVVPDQGFDYAMQCDEQSRLSSPIEGFVFADGSRYEWHELLVQSTPLKGSASDDILIGGRAGDTMDGWRGDDAMYGGSGNDTMQGGDGRDILYGFNGNDLLAGGNDGDELYGGAGNDWLDGGNGNDLLVDLQGDNSFYGGNNDDTVMAGAGNDLVCSDRAGTGATGNGRDIVQAGAGMDRIDTGNENDLIDAGLDDDFISAGNSDDWIAAGKGHDLIDGGNGRNLYAFNRGDGSDILAGSGNGKDTVSLGGGIRYAELSLAKTGNDLVLGLSQGDSMTLKNWYASSPARTVEKLQVITVGGDYDAASTDKTRNQQVEVFDFAGLVRRFDAARAADSANANGWAVMNSLLDAHLQGSDTSALGGDLSYQYATTGSLSGIGLAAAQASLGAGTGWQSLKSRAELEQGSVKLM